jgi:hypothetical protein
MSDTREVGKTAVDELFHYGVKGMRWGVRRKQRRAENASSTVTLRTTKLGNLKARGGSRRKPSAEARNAKVTEQVIRKSGTKALSNKQLKAYVERAELEQRADKIESRTNVGRQFVQALFEKKPA